MTRLSPALGLRPRPPRPQREVAMIWVRRAHLVFAWAFVAGVVVQVFLAGLGVFESSSRCGTHAGWGFLLGLLTIPLAILGGIGVGRRQALYGAARFGMFALQSILVTFRDRN